MPSLTAPHKFLISATAIFSVVGVAYLLVGLTAGTRAEAGVRNSTDEIGNRVLLSRADFADGILDSHWESGELGPELIDGQARFDDLDQCLESPSLHNAFTKYAVFQLGDVSGGPASFTLSGYDKGGSLLEEATISDLGSTERGEHRFSYDHVFIDKIVLAYAETGVVATVDYICIYALQ
ncbi:MAG: hypothetical protein WC344_03790 [Bacilli bacterium]|jgi:hypothetical protein